MIPFFRLKIATLSILLTVACARPATYLAPQSPSETKPSSSSGEVTQPPSAVPETGAGSDGSLAPAPGAPSPFSPSGQALIRSITLKSQPKYPVDFTHFDFVNPKAPKGGSFRQMVIGSFDHMTPFLMSGQAGISPHLVYESLMVAPANDFAAYPLVALGLELNSDHSQAIFHIHPKARWHDGKPITAADVVYSFDVFKNDSKLNPNYKAYYADVKSVTALSPSQVKFELVPRRSMEMVFNVATAPILAQHDQPFAGKPAEQAPLGSGPYRISKVSLGRQIIYERITNYWAQDLPTRRGFYNFDQIYHEFFRDIASARQAFSAQQLDTIHIRDARARQELATLPAVKDGKLVLSELRRRLPQTAIGYYFNTRRAPFNDLRVREALALLFDFEWTNKVLLSGWMSRAQGYFTGSEYAMPALPSAGELELLMPFKDILPQRVFTNKFEQPVTDGSGYLRPQLRQAFALLAQAGFQVKNQKLIDRNNKQVKIKILSDSSAVSGPVHAAYIANLARLGIEARLVTVDTAQFQNLKKKADYDLLDGYIYSPDPPGNEQRLLWGSASANQFGSINFSGVQDEVVDHLIEKMETAADFKGLVTATQALDRVLSWNFYTLRIGWLTSTHFAYWNKFGRADELDASGQPRTDLGVPLVDTWWVK